MQTFANVCVLILPIFLIVRCCYRDNAKMSDLRSIVETELPGGVNPDKNNWIDIADLRKNRDMLNHLRNFPSPMFGLIVHGAENGALSYEELGTHWLVRETGGGFPEGLSAETPSDSKTLVVVRAIFRESAEARRGAAGGTIWRETWHVTFHNRQKPETSKTITLFTEWDGKLKASKAVRTLLLDLHPGGAP